MTVSLKLEASGRVRTSKLHVRHSGHVAVVEPHGMLLGQDETLMFDREVRDLLQSGTKVVILDLAHVEHMDSIALGLLQQKHNVAQQHGATLALCNVNARNRETLRVLWLDRVLSIFETREQALQAFAVD